MTTKQASDTFRKVYKILLENNGSGSKLHTGSLQSQLYALSDCIIHNIGEYYGYKYIGKLCSEEIEKFYT